MYMIVPSSRGVPILLERSLWIHYGQSIKSLKWARLYSAESKRPKPDSRPTQEPKDVAIIGGGITGLATAHFLSEWSPDTRITLFEGGKRLGGWLHSEVVETSNGKVIFEKGPRTLRPNIPNGRLTLDLVLSATPRSIQHYKLIHCAD